MKNKYAVLMLASIILPTHILASEISHLPSEKNHKQIDTSLGTESTSNVQSPTQCFFNRYTSVDSTLDTVPNPHEMDIYQAYLALSPEQKALIKTIHTLHKHMGVVSLWQVNQPIEQARETFHSMPQNIKDHLYKTYYIENQYPSCCEKVTHYLNSICCKKKEQASINKTKLPETVLASHAKKMD